MRLSLALLLLTVIDLRAERPWWDLVPQKGDFPRLPVEEYKGVNPEQRKLLTVGEFSEWTEYEDEFVSLRYPRHPEIRFEILKGSNDLKVEGGVVTTVDNSAKRTYVLKVGDVTYGAFLLARADWLDDGICMCGSMIHHAYQTRDACLVRYSLLEGGGIKKAQILGDQLRLMAFEWTHLACPRTIYEKLVDGMRLKLPHPRDESWMRKEITRRYGFEGKTGWLRPGQTEREVIGLLGKPRARKDGFAVWGSEIDDCFVGLKANFENGKLTHFDGDGIHGIGGPRVGSLGWVDQNSSRYPSLPPAFDDGRGYLEAETKEDAIIREGTILEVKPERVAEALKELAPGSNGDRGRWDTWCEAVVSLHRMRGYRDEELLKLTLEASQGRRCEHEVLKEYKYPRMLEWVKDSMARFARIEPRRGNGAKLSHRDVFEIEMDALWMLRWQLENDNRAALGSTKALIAARNPVWARVVVRVAADLPPDLATKAMLEGLRSAAVEKDGELVQDVWSKFHSTVMDDPAAVDAELAKLEALRNSHLEEERAKEEDRSKQQD